MKPEVIAKLTALNHQFYQTFAPQFSATRRRLQPGVRRILANLEADANILDLGCGNGELARELARRGHQGVYIGLDLSRALLSEAQSASLSPLRSAFLQIDLTQANWSKALRSFCAAHFNLGDPKFEAILAFAVLHHIPSAPLRRQILNEVRQMVAPNGRFIHSEWQFHHSPRWRSRIQPWERIGLRPEDVDEGDYLIDWRHGGYGLRYVHLFNEDELETLASQAGFSIEETFYSDGEGGKLAIYQIWKPMVCN